MYFSSRWDVQAVIHLALYCRTQLSFIISFSLWITTTYHIHSEFWVTCAVYVHLMGWNLIYFCSFSMFHLCVLPFMSSFITLVFWKLYFMDLIFHCCKFPFAQFVQLSAEDSGAILTGFVIRKDNGHFLFSFFFSWCWKKNLNDICAQICYIFRAITIQKLMIMRSWKCQTTRLKVIIIIFNIYFLFIFIFINIFTECWFHTSCSLNLWG